MSICAAGGGGAELVRPFPPSTNALVGLSCNNLDSLLKEFLILLFTFTLRLSCHVMSFIKRVVLTHLQICCVISPPTA